MPRPFYFLALAALPAVGVGAPPALDAGEKELNAHWRGAAVILRLPSHSDCGGRYTNNVIRGDLVSSDGTFAFQRGELARVAKVNLGRRRLEVLLDLEEPLLLSVTDGPFVLYDEAVCKVELRIPRSGDDEVEHNALIADSLERHTDLDSARQSSVWNRRQRGPFPDDYEQTLAEYEDWKAEQLTVEIETRIADSIGRAGRLLRNVEPDPEYLDGYAAGLERARNHNLPRGCGTLLEKKELSFVDGAPRDRPSRWAGGYEDAQALYFHVELAARLERCLASL